MLTSVQSADTHWGISSIGMDERIAVWLINHSAKVDEGQESKHFLPRLGAIKVSDDLAVTSADRLVDWHVVAEGRITRWEHVATEQRCGYLKA